MPAADGPQRTLNTPTACGTHSPANHATYRHDSLTAAAQPAVCHSKSISRSTDSAVVAQLVQIRITV